MPSRPNLRGKGKINLFGHRQGIHIGAEGDHWPRLAALEDGHNTRMRDLVAYLVTELPEMLDHQSRCAELAVAQLGILVNVAPPRDHLGFDCFGLLIDCIANRIGVTGAARRDHKYCKGQDRRSREFHGGSPFTALTTEETSVGWKIKKDRARRRHALCR